MRASLPSSRMSWTGADERPDDVLVVSPEISLDGSFFHFICTVFPPAASGVIVVGSGVRHRVGDKLVGQVDMGAAAGKTELQDFHAGQAELLA